MQAHVPQLSGPVTEHSKCGSVQVRAISQSTEYQSNLKLYYIEIVSPIRKQALVELCVMQLKVQLILSIAAFKVYVLSLGTISNFKIKT